jgi:hypothetical protein
MGDVLFYHGNRSFVGAIGNPSRIDDVESCDRKIARACRSLGDQPDDDPDQGCNPGEGHYYRTADQTDRGGSHKLDFELLPRLHQLKLWLFAIRLVIRRA